MTYLQRRVTRLTAIFPPIVEPDLAKGLQLQALLTLPMQELESLQTVALRGGEQIAVNDAERFAMAHYREALLVVASERGVTA